MPRSQEELLELWRRYRETCDISIRNVLMENYLPLVRYNAERIWAKLPDEVDVNDLMSAGVFGLMDAIGSFDLSRGVKFETYCAPRIRGAILDELRMMDWVPRLVRARSNKLETATRALEAELGRLPTEDEIAARLGVARPEYDRLIRDANAVSIVSLSRNHFESDSGSDIREMDVLQDKRSLDPLTEIQKHDLRGLLTRGLTRTERLILILYYYEAMTMKEIGATLDLSESRVSQMHSAILRRLKTRLRAGDKDLVHEV